MIIGRIRLLTWLALLYRCILFVWLPLRIGEQMANFPGGFSPFFRSVDFKRLTKFFRFSSSFVACVPITWYDSFVRRGFAQGFSPFRLGLDMNTQKIVAEGISGRIMFRVVVDRADAAGGFLRILGYDSDGVFLENNGTAADIMAQFANKVSDYGLRLQVLDRRHGADFA